MRLISRFMKVTGEQKAHKQPRATLRSVPALLLLPSCGRRQCVAAGRAQARCQAAWGQGPWGCLVTLVQSHPSPKMGGQLGQRQDPNSPFSVQGAQFFLPQGAPSHQPPQCHGAWVQSLLGLSIHLTLLHVWHPHPWWLSPLVGGEWGQQGILFL